MQPVRGHNEGTIFQRKSGRWVAAVTMRDGRRPTRTVDTYNEARTALAELLRLRDARAPFTGRVRLGTYLERWVNEDHGWAPATARRHEGIVRVQLISSLGTLRLSDLSPADVVSGLQRLDLDPRTVSHVRATLRRALADAVRDGLIVRNAAALARIPTIPHRERPTLAAAQARLLIDSTRGTRYGPLWAILVTTGLRISEALGLAWSDVDSGGNDAPVQGRSTDDGRARRPADSPGVGRGASLTIRHQLAREHGEWVRRPPKTDKGRRVVPLTAIGVEALRAQRDQQRADRGALSIDGLVFTTERGHPIHATNLLPPLRRDLAAAGLPRVTLHDLRHSTATMLLTAGVPLPVVSRILGHANVRITMDLYVGKIPELAREAAERLQEALG